MALMYENNDLLGDNDGYMVAMVLMEAKAIYRGVKVAKGPQNTTTLAVTTKNR